MLNSIYQVFMLLGGKQIYNIKASISRSCGGKIKLVISQNSCNTEYQDRRFFYKMSYMLEKLNQDKSPCIKLAQALPFVKCVCVMGVL